MPTLSPSPNISSQRPAKFEHCLPAVHQAPVATPPPRKSPFKNRPPWAIRKPRQAFRSLSSNPLSNRRPRETRSKAVSRRPKHAAGLRSTQQNNLGVPSSAVQKSCWSGVALEDDQVHDSVGGSEPADSHNDNGE